MHDMPTPHDRQTVHRRHMHEAETALQEFRAEVRAELRARVVSAELKADTVTLLKDGLRDLRRDIVASLRG